MHSDGRIDDTRTANGTEMEPQTVLRQSEVTRLAPLRTSRSHMRYWFHPSGKVRDQSVLPLFDDDLCYSRILVNARDPNSANLEFDPAGYSDDEDESVGLYYAPGRRPYVRRTDPILPGTVVHIGDLRKATVWEFNGKLAEIVSFLDERDVYVVRLLEDESKRVVNGRNLFLDVVPAPRPRPLTDEEEEQLR